MIIDQFFLICFSIATVLVRLQKYKEAIETFDKLLKNKPNDTQILYMKAITLALDKQFDECSKSIIILYYFFIYSQKILHNILFSLN